MLIGIAVATALTLVPTGLANAFVTTKIVRYIYVIFIALWLGCMLVVSIYWGNKLMAVLKEIYQSTHMKTFRIFMRKVGDFPCMSINVNAHPALSLRSPSSYLWSIHF